MRPRSNSKGETGGRNNQCGPGGRGGGASQEKEVCEKKKKGLRARNQGERGRQPEKVQDAGGSCRVIGDWNFPATRKTWGKKRASLPLESPSKREIGPGEKKHPGWECVAG